MASGVVYTINSVADIKDALIDKYAAYDAGTNPNGVTIHYETTAVLVFSCLAISDKVIKLSNYTHGYMSYGDAWVSTTTITNEVVFGGSNYWVTTNTRKLILTTNSAVFNWYLSTDSTLGNTSGRVNIVGKMSNGKYICFGLYGGTSYPNGTSAFITDSSQEGRVVGLHGVLKSGAGETYKSKIYFTSDLGISQQNSDGTLAYLLDVEFCGLVTILPTSASGFFVTSGSTVMKLLNYGKYNSLIIELA